MRIISRKWWLTSLALLLLLPAASATMSPEKSHQRHRQSLTDPALTVPEGGSALVYVLGAGITCLGAMVVRSRSARPKQL
jgi:hypothetical protein